MQFEALAREDAVSPVIGVILMVAITVILAAVIGTFVLDMAGDVGQSPPQTNFGFEYDDGEDTGTGVCDLSTANDGGDGAVTVVHDGGDDVDANELEVVTGANRTEWSDCSDEDSTVRAGVTATVDVDANQTLRVAWHGSSGEDSSILGRWRGSDE